MNFKEKFYTIIWDSKPISELYSLFGFELAERIQNEVNRVLSVNPYGNFEDKVNIKNCITNIKPLNKNLKGWWRIRINDCRIAYKVEDSFIKESMKNSEEDKVLIRFLKLSPVILFMILWII